MNPIGAILLVEDDTDDVDLTRRAIQKNDLRCEIAIARSGQEALDYLVAACANSGRNPAGVPRVVLLDLKLPKVDGIAVLRHLRTDERTRRLPVVALTSSNEQEDILASHALGVNSFVRKPVNFSDFVKAIGILGRYWLQLNEPPPVPNP